VIDVLLNPFESIDSSSFLFLLILNEGSLSPQSFVKIGSLSSCLIVISFP